jgi:hypothetical protein
MTPHDADSLVEAIQQMKLASKRPVNVCLTSKKSKNALFRKCVKSKYASIDVAERYAKGEPQTYSVLGVNIISAPEIETDHAFFFVNFADANEFLEAIRRLKKQGFSWDYIIKGCINSLIDEVKTEAWIHGYKKHNSSRGDREENT